MSTVRVLQVAALCLITAAILSSMHQDQDHGYHFTRYTTISNASFSIGNIQTDNGPVTLRTKDDGHWSFEKGQATTLMSQNGSACQIKTGSDDREITVTGWVPCANISKE